MVVDREGFGLGVLDDGGEGAAAAVVTGDQVEDEIAEVGIWWDGLCGQSQGCEFVAKAFGESAALVMEFGLAFGDEAAFGVEDRGEAGGEGVAAEEKGLEARIGFSGVVPVGGYGEGLGMGGFEERGGMSTDGLRDVGGVLEEGDGFAGRGFVGVTVFGERSRLAGLLFDDPAGLAGIGEEVEPLEGVFKEG